VEEALAEFFRTDALGVAPEVLTELTDAGQVALLAAGQQGEEAEIFGVAFWTGVNGPVSLCIRTEFRVCDWCPARHRVAGRRAHGPSRPGSQMRTTDQANSDRRGKASPSLRREAASFNHSVEANRRPAAPLQAGGQFASRSSARPDLPAAAAHLNRCATMR
jgi:hypothetical protein